MRLPHIHVTQTLVRFAAVLSQVPAPKSWQWLYLTCRTWPMESAYFIEMNMRNMERGLGREGVGFPVDIAIEVWQD